MLQILGNPYTSRKPNQTTQQKMGLFLCDCGKKKRFLYHLGIKRKSCGCLDSRNTVGERSRTHGMCKTNTYNSWIDMKKRIFKDIPRYSKYKNLTICTEWVDSFDKFLLDMGECPKGLTLERVDNLKGYSKDNCKWATRLEQGRNTSRVIKYKGTSLKNYCAMIGMSYSVAHKRIKYRNWSVDEAVNTPVFGRWENK